MDMVRAVYMCTEMRFPNVVTLEPFHSSGPGGSEQTFRELPPVKIRFVGESPEMFELGTKYYLDLTKAE